MCRHTSDVAPTRTHTRTHTYGMIGFNIVLNCVRNLVEKPECDYFNINNHTCSHTYIVEMFATILSILVFVNKLIKMVWMSM